MKAKTARKTKIQKSNKKIKISLSLMIKVERYGKLSKTNHINSQL